MVSHLAINWPTPSSFASSLDTPLPSTSLTNKNFLLTKLPLPFLVKAKLSLVISAHFEVGLMSVNLNESDLVFVGYLVFVYLSVILTGKHLTLGSACRNTGPCLWPLPIGGMPWSWLVLPSPDKLISKCVFMVDGIQIQWVLALYLFDLWVGNMMIDQYWK